MKKNISVWIIIDEKVGNANQAIAVAQAMGESFETKKLNYNFLAVLPNRFKFDSLIGINLASSSRIEEPYPDLVISSGRKTAAVSRYIKKHSPKTFNVHIMSPDLPFDGFDLVCLPFHDKAMNQDKYSNILYTIGAPSYLDKNKITLEGKSLKEKIYNLKGPFISVIIGGKTKYGDYTAKDLEWLITKASDLAISVNGSLLITNSRRTNPSLSIEQYIKAPYFFYDWHKEKAQDNPYIGFLSLSDYFIVTGDSISSCSEALSTGKSVYIYRRADLLYKKHLKFLDYLNDLGYTKFLVQDTIIENWSYSPLKEADRICKVIKEKIDANNNFSS